MTVICGLIKGRHILPDSVTDYIFSADIPQNHICDSEYMEGICDKFLTDCRPDKVVVYVTGFTPALLALIKVCASRGIKLAAYNYDREKRTFWKQEVL